MNQFAQIFVIIIIILFNVHIVRVLRKEMLEYQYALVWMAAGLALLFFSIFPGTLSIIANWFGIGVPLNLAYFLLIIFGLLLNFQIIISYSKLKRKFYQVVQRLAIIENELVDLRSKEHAITEKSPNHS